MNEEDLKNLLNYVVIVIGTVLVVLFVNQDIPDFQYISWTEGVIVGLIVYSHLSLSHKIKRLQNSSEKETEE